ncbi:hypothetical protein [Phreatobacter sp. AB_2022a]|uniref:hypothetical protein n=1 Tax=Phreatobacter sp. AB_2022a TaxID=3003134 RepID=UPI002287143E|nr:hypothetical protein [Phreatobacter sp. AB_2022a]MCZ0734991.1 hypothetical protein [Phreatobacter sp. AB_2022a]
MPSVARPGDGRRAPAASGERARQVLRPTIGRGLSVGIAKIGEPPARRGRDRRDDLDAGGGEPFDQRIAAAGREAEGHIGRVARLRPACEGHPFDTLGQHPPLQPQPGMPRWKRWVRARAATVQMMVTALMAMGMRPLLAGDWPGQLP